jgi:hypothetical protein
MNGLQDAARYAAGYSPALEELLKPLPEAGDAFAAMLAELSRDATPDRVERALVRIEGIRQHLHRIHAALIRKAEGDER